MQDLQDYEISSRLAKKENGYKLLICAYSHIMSLNKFELLTDTIKDNIVITMISKSKIDDSFLISNL